MKDIVATFKRFYVEGATYEKIAEKVGMHPTYTRLCVNRIPLTREDFQKMCRNKMRISREYDRLRSFRSQKEHELQKRSQNLERRIKYFRKGRRWCV